MDCKVIIDRDMLSEPDLSAMGLAEFETLRMDPEAQLALGETGRVVYILSLLSGGLRYQVEFIRNNPGVAQWLIVAFTESSLTIGRFRDMISDARVPVRVIRADWGKMDEIKKSLRAIPEIRPNTCLIYSKRPFTGKRTAAILLQQHCPGWKFETCDGDESVLGDRCVGVSRVLVMGRSIQDFSLAKPEILDTPPLFLYNKADENLQHFLQPEWLWNSVRVVLGTREWRFPEEFPDFFVGSMLYERWNHTASPEDVESLRLDDEFVMWDSWGLPVCREEYSADSIRSFLKRFTILEALAARILKA